MAVIGQQQPREVWRETVHGDQGRYQAASLRQRADGTLEFHVGDRVWVPDDRDALTLFHALGDALMRMRWDGT